MAEGLLQILFNFTTPHTTVFDTEFLAAFLYGNGLRFNVAEQLVRACTTWASDDLLNYMHSLYDDWNARPDDRHLSIYWNMAVHTYVWLNGSNGPYFEEYGFIEVGPNSDKGFGFHPRTWPLRAKLARLRRTVLYTP
jgi:hypothetical protein